MNKKHDLNTSYGKKVINRENARIAAKIADRAIQQTVDSDELECRLQGLFEPEIIEMACELVNDFFSKSEDRNFFEEWLTDGKSMNVSELLSHYNISPRREGSTACMEEWGDC